MHNYSFSLKLLLHLKIKKTINYVPLIQIYLWAFHLPIDNVSIRKLANQTSLS